jgi:iron complex outermembrane receptor protein
VHRYEVSDASVTGGLKGTWNALQYDFSGSLARSRSENGVFNTVNPSLGPTSPTDFAVGNVQQDEQQLHADFVYGWNTGLFVTPLNVAFGAEYRRERYKLEAGEPDSYRTGPFARVFDADNNRFVGLAVGASAFPGFQPSQAGSWARNSGAAYLDLEADVVERLTLGAAGRYEKFQGAGDTFIYKFTGRYKLLEALAVRGSYNTGFRAPTPGQSHVTATSTSINLNNGTLLQNVTLPPSDPISQYYGASALKPEKSKNYSFGAVVTLPDGFLFTADYFHIKVEDRISVTSLITINAADQALFAARGIALNGTQAVQFYANAFDTKTHGLDFVLSKRWDLGAGYGFNLSSGANFTQTSLSRLADARAVDRERAIEIKHFNPTWRGNVTGTLEQGPWSLMGRANYYGKWIDAVPAVSAVAFDQTHSARWLIDMEASYNITENFSLAVGGNNIFNTYPEKEKLPANIANGMLYPQHSPYGYNGGFWYVRATAKF